MNRIDLMRTKFTPHADMLSSSLGKSRSPTACPGRMVVLLRVHHSAAKLVPSIPTTASGVQVSSGQSSFWLLAAGKSTTPLLPPPPAALMLRVKVGRRQTIESASTVGKALTSSGQTVLLLLSSATKLGLAVSLFPAHTVGTTAAFGRLARLAVEMTQRWKAERARWVDHRLVNELSVR